MVGPPQLTLSYQGSAVIKPNTHVYAQIADPTALRVLGNQATPIPLQLDGAPHTISRPLEPVASRALAGKNYQLQIVSNSNLYGAQTTTGAVNFSDIHVELPLVDAAGTPAPPGGAAGSPTSGATKRKCAKKKTRAKRKKCKKRNRHRKHR